MSVDSTIVKIAALIAAVGIIWGAFKIINRFIRRSNQVYEDWYGFKGDASHPPVPGLVARVGTFEGSLDEIKDAQVTLAESQERLERKVDDISDMLNNKEGDAS